MLASSRYALARDNQKERKYAPEKQQGDVEDKGIREGSRHQGPDKDASAGSAKNSKKLTRAQPNAIKRERKPTPKIVKSRRSGEERPSCAILRSAGARTSDIHGSYPTRSLAQTENSWGMKPKHCLVRVRKLISPVRPRLPCRSHGEGLMGIKEGQPVHGLLTDSEFAALQLA